jgi:predicted XRE-type DNA-binding protein
VNEQAIETTSTGDPAPHAGLRLFAGKLHRVQHGHGKGFSSTPPASPPLPVRRPARIAIMLALAHKIQDAIESGVVQDQAEVARRLGLTRARITQLMDLTLLAPEIQEEILGLESVDGVEPMSERALRHVSRTLDWGEQRRRWSTLK